MINTSTYKVFRTPEEVSVWINASYTNEQLDAFDMNRHMDKPIADYKVNGYRQMKYIIRKGWVTYTGVGIFHISGEATNRNSLGYAMEGVITCPERKKMQSY